MDSTEHDWSLYRTFLAVLRTGSLSAAARFLGTTQPTVGRQIAALEKTLGGKALFTRSQTGLLPTDVARELSPHAEAMAASADALMRAASAKEDEVAGVIRLSASEVVGAEVLPPMLVEFRTAHPHVEIELGLTNETVDLLRRDADIAVRMIKPEQKSLIARRAGKVMLAFHASREYIDRFGMPQSVEDLSRHALIGFDKMTPPQRIVKTVPFKVTRDLFAFRCDSDLGQLAAIRAGFGIGACQYGVADREPALVPVLEHAFRFEFEIWVAMHENLKKSQRMRLMFDHLVASLGSYAKRSARA
jgi:DNA-binding transcriptional LysR family regulator